MCIGGDFYFTEDGRPLGQVGSGTNMRIVNEHVFEHSQSNESDLINGSSSFGDSSYESRLNSILEMASGIGISNVSLYYNSDSTIGGRWNSTDGISINTNTKWFQSGNYYEIKLILLHENQHALNSVPEEYRTDPVKLAPYEARAYERIIGSSDFSRTSSDFQKGILASYEKLKKNLPPNWESL